MENTISEAIAAALTASRNCDKTRDNGGFSLWGERWAERLDQLDQALPSGGGIDNGTEIDRKRSTDRKLVLHTSFHHMSESGMYDGWTDHTVTVHATFNGVDVRVSGRNRNEIKDYLADLFAQVLSEPAPDYPDSWTRASNEPASVAAPSEG